MSYISVVPLQNYTALRTYAEREEINLSPDYQRLGGIWSIAKKQLLIDSILNEYDIPKIYFHNLGRDTHKETGFSYAVIDGRQRLEAIWDFMDGEFNISEDFVYQDDENIRLAGMSYEEISQKYPRIKIKFDSFVLPIIGVSTDDMDLIEDMFSRLNEAVPLNAAEKRNAFGGNMVMIIRELVKHDFFEKKIRINNNRYKHHEIVTKFLFLEKCLLQYQKIIDTKKEYLDAFVKEHKDENEINRNIRNCVVEVLNTLCRLFDDKDDLLSAQGNMAIYYLLIKSALKKNEIKKISRDKLYEFFCSVKLNRNIAAHNLPEAKFELLEFDKLSQQGTNDASNIRERVKILQDFFCLSKIETESYLL